MYQLKRATLYLYRHNLMRYLFVGGSTFIIDLSLLYLLHGHLGLNLQLATSIAYWSSIAYNFLLNRSWTFTNTERKKLHEHALFYGLLLLFNYLYTLAAVSLLSNYMHYGTAKVLAVVIQTSWTYYLYKYYVFGSSRSSKKIKARLLRTIKPVLLPRGILILTSMLLFVSVFFSALRMHSLNTANNIDGSWSYALSSLRHHPEQSLGNDIFFTYGPLSTKIIGTVYHADAFGDWFVSITLLSLLLASSFYLLWQLFRRIRAIDIAIIGGLLALLLLGEPSIDSMFFAIMLVVAAYLRTVKHRLSILHQALLLGLPMVVSTHKNNLLIAMLFTIVLVSASSKSLRRFFASISTLLITYYLIFTALGISFLKVPQFITYSVLDALSYNEFMSLDMNEGYTITYFAALFIYGSMLAVALYHEHIKKKSELVWQYAAAYILELWILWVVFKEASTRSDGHIIIFLPFFYYILARCIFILYPRILKNKASYLWIGASLIGVSLFMVSTVPDVLKMPRSVFLKRSTENLLMVEAVHAYDYDHFLKLKADSGAAFRGLVRDTEPLRDILPKSARHKEIVGYTNTIFYLPAITDKYMYAPFLQTYQAFPTSLFDELFLKNLEKHPDQLVFWTNLNPSIDGRMPAGDLPKTYEYIKSSYRVLASYNGLYVFEKAQQPDTKNSSTCQTITKSSFTNTVTKLDVNSANMRIVVHDKNRFIIDMLYKKPVFHLHLYDKDGLEKVFRTTPSLLATGVDIKPLEPSLVDELNSERFIVRSFLVGASDQREAPVTLSQKVCK